MYIYFIRGDCMKYNNYSEDEIIKLYHHYKSANKVISKTGIYKFKVYEILI